MYVYFFFQHKLARKTFACQRVREVDPEVEMYVVTSCPRQFKDVWVREQCGRETTSDDLFYRVPVSGVQSTLVYRNYYCALCNGETNVTFWQVGSRQQLLLRLLCRRDECQSLACELISNTTAPFVSTFSHVGKH